jgi:uncharacterized membrane protein YdjX (TVP38/TMEM64 family)
VEITILDKRTAGLTAYTFWCVGLMAAVSVFFRHLPLWVNFVLYIVLMLLALTALVTSFTDRKALFRLCVTAAATLTLLCAVYVVLDLTGAVGLFTDLESIKSVVQSAGSWGMIIFVAIQVLQVALLPIPGVLVTLAGVALYGSLKAFLLSLTGMVIGSVAAFSMGKLFGKAFVEWVAGKENSDKYRKLFNEKGRVIFILMLMFPMFPDDMLCMVAGITAMSYPYFIAVMLLTRPLGLAATCFFGSGKIIPFSGWGLWAWGGIFVLFAAIFWLINKYKKPITEKLTALFGGKKK